VTLKLVPPLYYMPHFLSMVQLSQHCATLHSPYQRRSALTHLLLLFAVGASHEATSSSETSAASSRAESSSATAAVNSSSAAAAAKVARSRLKLRWPTSSSETVEAWLAEAASEVSAELRLLLRRVLPIAWGRLRLLLRTLTVDPPATRMS